MPTELFLRGRVYYIRGTVGPPDRSIRVYKSTGARALHVAEAFQAQLEKTIWDEITFGKRAVVSFAAGAASYLEFVEPAPQDVDRVDRLVAHFGPDKKLNAIDQLAVEDACKKLLAADASNATKIRNVYTPLTAILTHCAVRKLCDKPAFQRPPEPRPEAPKWILPSVANELVAAAGDHLKPIMVFAFCTGARVSEMLGLVWERDVDLRASKVTFRGTKGGRDRTYVMPPRAVGALEALPSREGNVFRRPDGKPYTAKEAEGGQFKKAWLVALRKVGLAEQVLDDDGLQRRMGDGRPIWRPLFTPHGMRHTWATWYQGVMQDPMRLMVVGGWSRLSMVEIYAHLMSSEHIEDAIDFWGAHPENNFGAKPVQRLRVIARNAHE